MVLEGRDSRVCFKIDFGSHLGVQLVPVMTAFLRSLSELQQQK